MCEALRGVDIVVDAACVGFVEGCLAGGEGAAVKESWMSVPEWSEPKRGGNMKVLGVVLVLLGAGVGLYVGGYLCFIGGIIQIIQAVRAEEFVASQVAWGVGRVMGAGLVGGLCTLAPVAAGMALLKD